jgi:secreted trypsin-like serine protease
MKKPTSNFPGIGSSIDRPTKHRDLIIGGQDADPHSFPFFSTLNHFCGGALIAPDIVLTAGHCKPRHDEKVMLRVGVYAHNTGTVFAIQQSIHHPLFERRGDDDFVYDFAILKLEQPAIGQRYISVNSNPNIPKNDEILIAIGMGLTDLTDPDSRPKILQQVSLQAVANDQCELSHRKDVTFQDRIETSHLCTTGKHRDACAYDSGSPIFTTTSSSLLAHSDEPLLVALVSWGEGCADPDFPGVNARVSDVYPWIADMVCDMSEHAPRSFHCASGTILSTSTKSYMAPVLLLVAVLVWYRRRLQPNSNSKVESSSILSRYESDDSDESSLYGTIETAEL